MHLVFLHTVPLLHVVVVLHLVFAHCVLLARLLGLVGLSSVSCLMSSDRASCCRSPRNLVSFRLFPWSPRSSETIPKTRSNLCMDIVAFT